MREFELKFDIRPQDGPRLLAHPLLKRQGAGTKHLVSTYFDTDALALKRRGLSLRIRRSDEAFATQTLKRTGTSKVDRDEWERGTLGHLPNHKWLRKTPAARNFKKGRFPKDLEAQFTIEVERAVIPIAYDKAVIEGALDVGVIRAGGVCAPVSEFELELKAGHKRAVHRLARELVRDVPLVLNLSSKSERGYRVADLTHGHPTSMLVLSLPRKATLAQAFEAIVQSCLYLVLTNTNLIGADRDGEAIHDARMALRRLRAALELFRPYLRPRHRRAVRRDLRWMTRRLGEVRDIDVLLAVVGESPDHGRYEVVDGLRQRRRASHANLRRALASPRWRLLLLNLLKLSMKGVRRRKRKTRFRGWARRRLAKHHASLSARARHLSDMPQEARHGLRKSTKTLRYNLDILARLRGWGRTERMTRLRRHLHDLQDELGGLRDGEILRSFLRSNGVFSGVEDDDRAATHIAAAIDAARLITRTRFR